MSDEKFDEKEAEKREEKSSEKSWDEKWRRDPVSSVIWASIFIWAGLVLLAGNLGLLDPFSPDPGIPFFAWADTWSVILLGAGIIVLMGAAARLLMPIYRRPVTGDLILGVILFGIGLSNLFGWEIVWPLIIIAIGLSILLRGFMRGRS